MNEIIGMVIIGIGVAFDILGCIGLIRLPDVYNRLQASTKCVTLGTCSIMFGTFIMQGFSSLGIKALICIPFIFLTSPVAAHALARGAHIFGIKFCSGSIVDKYEEDKSKNVEV